MLPRRSGKIFEEIYTWGFGDNGTALLESKCKHKCQMFVFSSKMLVSSLSVEVVINSAMMAGGNAKATVEELQRLMLTGFIFPPSAIRLICLINGRRCEVCGVNRVKHVRKGFGINVCWKCVTSGDTTEMICPKNYKN